jgi:hypothetical protein
MDRCNQKGALLQDGRVTRQEIVDLITSLGGDPECPHAQVRHFKEAFTLRKLLESAEGFKEKK